MSASNYIDGHSARASGNRQIVALWSFGFGYIVVIFSLLLLSRVGLPATTSMQLMLAALATCFMVALWAGKTMTSADYFYAGRVSPVSVTGLGGMTDWLGGTVLLSLALLPLEERTWLIIAIMAAMVLQMVLFSRGFQRSGVSTVPGFLAWRYGSRLAGLSALSCAGISLVMLLLAELQVGVAMLMVLTDLPAPTVLGLFLAVASLPALLGGWKALLLTTSLLGLCALISLLAPAVATGFFVPLLTQNQELGQAVGMAPSALPRLAELFSFSDTTSLKTDDGWPPIAMVLLLALGFSVLPASLSRLSLSDSAYDALEGGTWSALTAFLAISSVPLSLLLISVSNGVGDAASELATVLSRSSVLHAVPYLALLAAAGAAFSVSLFAVGAGIARTLRRTRNLDPGERSMFTTRLACLAVVTALWFLAGLRIPDPQTLLLMAVSVLAGGLFPVMVAACWLSRIPMRAVAIAIVAGTIVPIGLLLVQVLESSDPTMPEFFGSLGFAPIAGSGVLAASICLLIGRVVRQFTQSGRDDPNLMPLRSSGFED